MIVLILFLFSCKSHCPFEFFLIKKSVLSFVHYLLSIVFFLGPSFDLYLLDYSGLARKKKAGAWSPLAFFYPRRVVSYRWSKNNILASLCLASYLAVNWLQKLETKHCAYYAEVISVLMCVWYLSLIYL